MNYLVEQTLRSKIENLAFIDRYGGLTQIVRVNTQNGIKAFPVSSYVSQKECFEDGKYLDLVPNDAYKSVSYWEPQQVRGPQFEGAKQNEASLLVNMRFVCWMNLQELGISNAINAERYMLSTMKAIRGQHAFDIDNIQGVVNVRSFSTPEQTTRNIFGRYSYGEDEKFFFFPYTFFAFDLTANVVISSGCIPDLTVGTALDCEPSSKAA